MARKSEEEKAKTKAERVKAKASAKASAKTETVVASSEGAPTGKIADADTIVAAAEVTTFTMDLPEPPKGVVQYGPQKDGRFYIGPYVSYASAVHSHETPNGMLDCQYCITEIMAKDPELSEYLPKDEAGEPPAPAPVMSEREIAMYAAETGMMPGEKRNPDPKAKE